MKIANGRQTEANSLAEKTNNHMKSFARLAVNVPSLAGVFDYGVPELLEGRVQAGSLVTAPFGKQTVQGVVLGFVDQPSVPDPKDLLSVLDSAPALTQAQIKLAASMAATTASPLAAVLGLFLPPGLGQQTDTQYSIVNEGLPVTSNELPVTTNQLASTPAPLSAGTLAEGQKRLVKLLAERGPLRGRQIDRLLPHSEWRKTAQSLVKRGLLQTQSVLPPVRLQPKFIRTAQLAVTPDAADSATPSLGNRLTQSRRAEALRYLIGHPEPVNISWVRAASGCNLADLQELAERELITLRESEVWRDPLEGIDQQLVARGEVILTREQQVVWSRIEAGIIDASNSKRLKPFLLQGVTGSGKTELYIRAACETVKRGRQAIILVPEIALTPQTVQRFLERFPGETGLIHSRLSDGERYDTWRRARLGLLKVIIGPRSALFAPLPDVGLIVVDECHDASYYQADPPFYNATIAGQAYAEINSAVCLMGSATPSIVQRYQAEVGRSERLVLTHRVGPEAAGGAQELQMPSVQIVDMRAELKAGSRGVLSRLLREALENVLERQEQAILFMNRRGSATYVFCRVCGFAMKCPRCDSPLTYHAAAGDILQCHRCGYTGPMPHKCTQCGNRSMRAYGLGTERVEAEIQREFPDVRTLRWDWETTREKDAHAMILRHFAAGRADLLIGTQMLAKGLDLPRVTLVGMILADVGLHLPDPYAAERVFQVLTQVAGRAGRRAPGGMAVLQTFEPEHYAIQSAAAQDVDQFYREESGQRRRLGYPPFAGLVRLEVRNADAERCEYEARALAGKLRQQMQGRKRGPASILGPAPCFYARLGGRYRWQIILRGPDLRDLLPARLGPDWRIEVEPASLL